MLNNKTKSHQARLVEITAPELTLYRLMESQHMALNDIFIQQK